MGPAGAPYCVVADLANYLPASVIALASSGQQTQACLDATEEADSFMRGRYTFPLLAWGADVRMRTAHIAVYHLCEMIGFRPEAGADDLIVKRYYSAVGWPDRPGSGWFPGVQRQSIHPDVTPTVVQPGDAIHDLPQVRTSLARGWQTAVGGKPSIQ